MGMILLLLRMGNDGFVITSMYFGEFDRFLFIFKYLLLPHKMYCTLIDWGPILFPLDNNIYDYRIFLYNIIYLSLLRMGISKYKYTIFYNTPF